MGSMGLTLPTEDGSSGVWDTLLNAAMALIEEHDHSSGKGVQVGVNGLDIDDDIDMGGYDFEDCGGLQLTSYVNSATFLAAVGVRSLGVVSNELYWKTSAGAAVQITSGTGLNVSLVGGIEGDYSTTDAAVNYSDALKAYQFLQDETPNYWAEGRFGDLALFEKASGITNFVRLKSPGSLAASYDLTFPGALPGSTSLATFTSAGVMAFTRDPSVDTVTATGLIDGASVQTDQADIRHGERTQYLPACAAMSAGGHWSYNPVAPATGTQPYWDNPNINEVVAFPLHVPDGARLKSVSVVVQDTAGSHTVSFQLGEVDVEHQTVTQRGATQTSAGDGSVQTLTVSGLTLTQNTMALYAYVEADDGTTTTHKVYSCFYTYDRVA